MGRRRRTKDPQVPMVFLHGIQNNFHGRVKFSYYQILSAHRVQSHLKFSNISKSKCWKVLETVSSHLEWLELTTFETTATFSQQFSLNLYNIEGHNNHPSWQNKVYFK